MYADENANNLLSKLGPKSNELHQLNQELQITKERYEKLFEAHKKLQTLNSMLEERLLRLVEEYGTDKAQLQNHLTAATNKVSELEASINELEQEKIQLKNDCNLAVRLLHKKPDSYCITSLNSLPLHLREQLKSRLNSNPYVDTSMLSVNNETPNLSPLMAPTFPPTFVPASMMLNNQSRLASPSSILQQQQTRLPSENTDYVSPKLVAELLYKTDSVQRKTCVNYQCTQCRRNIRCSDVSVQTIENLKSLSRLRVVSMSSDDGNSSSYTDIYGRPDPINEKNSEQWLALEDDHCFNIREANVHSTCAIPAMHHV
ncbi:unnamed protein product [Didymodactylos carnosus]|uniref:Tight junction-associated protein 1 n=1 Tax=Didymodactylos carnosus TaxID=1234261 RepID=A0A814DEC4_9BILA|nr:unnamed protein product [Didymodactylos carnosus]CAF1560403.1 unnamed protein product [Didymodactylos carnosus]CAF3729541.1 unnamed protein product [Didymodactylos carnosus]CAF4352087.1 unnamed protein product [Didymodactylos carnosus]